MRKQLYNFAVLVLTLTSFTLTAQTEDLRKELRKAVTTKNSYIEPVIIRCDTFDTAIFELYSNNTYFIIIDKNVYLEIISSSNCSIPKSQYDPIEVTYTFKSGHLLKLYMYQFSKRYTGFSYNHPKYIINNSTYSQENMRWVLKQQ